MGDVRSDFMHKYNTISRLYPQIWVPRIDFMTEDLDIIQFIYDRMIETLRNIDIEDNKKFVYLHESDVSIK